MHQRDSSVMFGNLSDIIKIPVAIIAGMIIATVALVLFYEGISLPILGQVINGDVANRIDAAKASMVTHAELDAANALLAKARNEARQNSLAADAARKQADSAAAQLKTTQDKLDAAISEDTGADGCRVGDDDLQWLQHR